MSHVSVNSLQRRLKRLEDQAARQLLDHSQIEITCCWANEDQGPRQPGVTYIVTDWSIAPALEREDREQ